MKNVIQYIIVLLCNARAMASILVLVTVLLAGAVYAAEANTFPLEQAERRIAAALGEKGAAEYLDVRAVRYRMGEAGKLYSLEQLKRLEFASADVSLAALDFDTSGHFHAVLRAEPSGREIGVQGRFEPMEQVPTLRKIIAKGGLIRREDIVRVGVPVRRMKEGMIGDEESLVGFSAVRTIYPGRPIRQSDVARPVLVEKGAAVKLMYRKPYMELQDLGEALEQGSAGDVVRVRNVTSGKIVAARIEGPGMALVNYAQPVDISNLPQKEELYGN